MKAFTRPFASVFKKNFSSQTAAKVAPSAKLPSNDVKITQLPNGVVVASVENGAPVSRVAIVYNAGPRFESYENQGVTHYIRTLSSQSTERISGFGLTRNIQQLGGNISCTTNREQVIYTLESLRNHLDDSLNYLDYMANMPAFKPWEIVDAKAQMELQKRIFEQSLDTRVIELIHKAAYRDTLGNSLYVKDDLIGSFKQADLAEFHATHCVAGNAAVVGIGVDHDLLVKKVRSFHFKTGQAPQVKKSKYYGGELREEIKGDLAFVTCVTESIGLSSPELLPLSLLQHVIGVGPCVKYSTNQVSKLYKAAASVATSPFAVSCISCNYSDSGLFGLNLVAGAKDSGAILKSVFAIMNQAAKGQITDADIQRAKNHLKTSLHFYGENSKDLLENLGVEVLLSKQYLNQRQVDAAIDKITAEEVSNVAKKVITGKPAMASVGNLSHTPYLDDLFGQ